MAKYKLPSRRKEERRGTFPEGNGLVSWRFERAEQRAESREQRAERVLRSERGVGSCCSPNPIPIF